jgi:hypothetical protein
VICDMGAYEAGSVPPPPPAYVYLPLVQKSGPQITPTPTATPGTTTPTPTQTITPTVQPTNPPPSGPKLGTWNFTSMQLPVNYTYFTSYFYVTSNGVGYMDVTWTWVSSGGTSCKAELNATGTTHSGNTFSFMGTHFDGSGTFTSNTSASGTFNAHVDALPYYPCGSINLTNRSWSATWSSSYLP